MDYKCCVCDMDGTLLNSDGLISIENEKALKKLKEKGIEVIIASGRTDLLMKPYIKQLGLEEHIICCNGGLVKKIKTGEVVYKNPIKKEIAEDVISYCFNNAINFLVYTNDVVYSNSNNPRAKKFENLNQKTDINERISINYMEYFDKDKFSSTDIFKVLIIEEDDERKESISRYFEQYTNLSVVTSAKGLLDIMASGVSKGNAITHLAEKLSIDLKQIIAFGDNYNDLEMFRAVGFSVAMGNSIEEIKSISSFITLSNDESGVAYALDNLVL